LKTYFELLKEHLEDFWTV